ncbi:hypothetical protein J6590_084945 [Homalodisca vitripennis]|nr:hypothetical protein J6590_084945 [Homalodisca vitripennis]
MVFFHTMSKYLKDRFPYVEDDLKNQNNNVEDEDLVCGQIASYDRLHKPLLESLLVQIATISVLTSDESTRQSAGALRHFRGFEILARHIFMAYKTCLLDL